MHSPQHRRRSNEPGVLDPFDARQLRAAKTVQHAWRNRGKPKANTFRWPTIFELKSSSPTGVLPPLSPPRQVEADGGRSPRGSRYQEMSTTRWTQVYAPRQAGVGAPLKTTPTLPGIERQRVVQSPFRSSSVPPVRLPPITKHGGPHNEVSQNTILARWKKQLVG